MSPTHNPSYDPSNAPTMKLNQPKIEKVRLEKETPKQSKSESIEDDKCNIPFIAPIATEKYNQREIKLSDDTQKEYKIFTENIISNNYAPIKAESSVYRGNYRKYEPKSLNTIQNEIDILTKKINQRNGNDDNRDWKQFFKRKEEIYGVFGLIALLIAGKMLYGKREKPKAVTPLPFTKSFVIFPLFDLYHHLEKYLGINIEKNKTQMISTQIKENQQIQNEIGSSIQTTSHIDYLHPNIIKTKDIFPMPMPIHGIVEIEGDTEIIFPADLRFGGSLLEQLKNDYVVSQYNHYSLFHN